MEEKFANVCIVCGTTLTGPLGWLFHLFGIERSTRNPNICSRCDTHMQEGHVIELSVLFADLTGFTEMTNRLGAEKSYDVVNAFFKMANEVLVANDAFIDKYIGDAVMAIFNAPIQDREHSRKAISAALGIQEKIKDLAKELDLDLQARVGVASGFARVGSVGSKDRRDYTAIGDVVNLASRLETFARPGEIMIDEKAFTEVSADFPSLTSETLTVRGFPEPVSAYRLGKGDQSAKASTIDLNVPLMRHQTTSIGAVLFAILGAPCAAVSILSPLAVILGTGSLIGAIAPTLGFLDSTPVRIPLQIIAILGAITNLYVIWYGRRQRMQSGKLQLTRNEHRKVNFVAAMSILSLIAVAYETYAHIFIEGHALF